MLLFVKASTPAPGSVQYSKGLRTHQIQNLAFIGLHVFRSRAPAQKKNRALPSPADYTSRTCTSLALIGFLMRASSVQLNCAISPCASVSMHLTGRQRVDIQVFAMKSLVLLLKPRHQARRDLLHIPTQP